MATTTPPTPPTPPAPGTDRAALRALRTAGKTYREISAITGLSKSAINYRLHSTPSAAKPPTQPLAKPLAKPPTQPPSGKVRRVRLCLSCGMRFESEGPHNRMCDACRRKSGNPFGMLVRHR